MKYTVGQILYLIGEKSMRVLPIQIIEEVITTTVDGSVKTHTVLLPDPEGTHISINDIKGQIFTSKQDIRSHMIKNATEAIDNMLVQAKKLSDKKFKIKDNIISKVDILDIPDVNNSSVVQDTVSDDIIRVDLGNGNFAKMSTTSLQKIGE